MNKSFFLLSLIMGVVVLSSNYLVQFPIKYYGLEEILTYGAFSYPIAFLITDLANRSYGKLIARNIVYIGFIIGISFTLLFSTNFADLISIRIAIGSGTAFLVAQLLDVQIFDNLRKKDWFIATLSFNDRLISFFRCIWLNFLSGGGAGLIQLPALLFFGLPFSKALATHKVASVALGIGASVPHLKRSRLQIKYVFILFYVDLKL